LKDETKSLSGQGEPPATRIFSPLTVAGLCVTIGRYWYLFKRLTAVSARRFFPFEYIVGYSFCKIVAKTEASPPEIVDDDPDGSLIGGKHKAGVSCVSL